MVFCLKHGHIKYNQAFFNYQNMSNEQKKEILQRNTW